MFSQISRVSCARSAVAAAARAAKPNAVQMRTFIAPTVSRRADFVQDLYLKELKSYKMPPVKESDADGHVQTFNLPKTPASPEETDLAGNLKEYESMAVDIEGQDTSKSTQAAAEVPDWLEAEEDESAH